MAWEIDPDFALQSRVVFGRKGVLLWTVACAAAVVSAATASHDFAFGMLLLTPGLACLAVAIVALMALEWRRCNGLEPRS